LGWVRVADHSRCASIKPSRFDAHNAEHRMVRFYIGLETRLILLRTLNRHWQNETLRSGTGVSSRQGFIDEF
jgi:hypothetical protein